MEILFSANLLSRGTFLINDKLEFIQIIAGK